MGHDTDHWHEGCGGGSVACLSRRDRGAPGPGESGASSSTSATFGTLPSPCGKGHATGATDQGVTNSTINIAYGDDRGFSGSPGLDQEMGDAVKAMIAWCEAQGGINGRKIVGD